MSNNTPLLRVENLKMYFPQRKGLIQRTYAQVKAVDDVSFSVNEGETFGIVGESGCGKTTTARCILRVYRPTGGHIYYRDKDISRLTENGMRPYRRAIQLIFQDPYGSLDPRQSVASIISEAVSEDGVPRTKTERKERVDELLKTVELDPLLSDRYPHEMSGGQRQRLGIARALACNPELIVCDEPVSALDVSIQAQIINLFKRLQEELGLTYVFVAHDLAVVRHISHKIAVMYLGRVMEITDASDLYHTHYTLIPKHFCRRFRLRIIMWRRAVTELFSLVKFQVLLTHRKDVRFTRVAHMRRMSVRHVRLNSAKLGRTTM